MQVVIFKIKDELFASDINFVKEILKMLKITRLPNSGPSIEGVSNIRGEIIPMVSGGILVRGTLNVGDNSRVVVISEGKRKFGLIVDTVSEILTVTDENIEPLTMGSSEYVNRVIKVRDDLVQLISIDKLLQKLGGAHVDESSTLTC